MPKHLIFAYGTLRKGFLNHPRFLSTAEYLGTGKTADKFRMVAEGLPYVDKKPVTQIIGDLFAVSGQTLSVLDEIERHPHWYCREEVKVEVGGMLRDAWLYFNCRSAATDGVKIVESGDFSDYVTESGLNHYRVGPSLCP